MTVGQMTVGQISVVHIAVDKKIFDQKRWSLLSLGKTSKQLIFSNALG
jgi:hypothetical protein